ncbi:hypothetical protein XELAEV_18040671mg [Xenopus laevis]|uniref:Uncharacterized protein n=1 Tax=Xenopus laevis TaxID=8355 RepID=A0A974CA39_XENLA|nr:hypothetical protein XELAEV_18040671mg [Xenopus laevis]
MDLSNVAIGHFLYFEKGGIIQRTHQSKGCHLIIRVRDTQQTRELTDCDIRFLLGSVTVATTLPRSIQITSEDQCFEQRLVTRGRGTKYSKLLHPPPFICMAVYSR